MKSWMRLLLLATLPAAAVVRVDFARPAGAVFDPSGLGTAAPVWNGPGRYATWAEGFRRGGFRTFRFPNGTLSNEYHWNGKGEFDSVGLWHPSAAEVGPGFTAYGLWRGTTKYNYDARLASHLTDGDTATLWWGETYEDSIRPWAILDLRAPTDFDSVEVLWGARRPESVRVEVWTGAAYPPPQHADPAGWKAVLEGRVTGGRSRLAGKPGTGRYVALRPGPSPNGVQVREVRLFRKGQLVTVNDPDPKRQTSVAAISAHPGSAGRAQPWIPEWTFDRFAAWLGTIPGSQALICVNFGTGTPEEAAAWVRYANVQKKYGIRKWHVGNEVDGHWEEGGPVDPAQYAVRFAAFSKAMKAVDPTIEVYGPASYSTEFWRRRSGRADGLSWMESFLVRIAALERAQKTRLVDGIDFHSYPYWFEQGPAREDSMLVSIGRFGEALDTLQAMMVRRLDDPASRMVSLSEFNTTVKVTAITMEATNGLGVAMMLQDLWSRHPDKSVSILWEPCGGEPMNPDGSPVESYGSLRLFTPPRGGLVSDLGDAPTGSFWGQYLVRAWMGGPGTRVVPAATPTSALRTTLATDSVTWSALAINPSEQPETLAVAFPAGAPRGGEVLAWGAAHYRWTDRTSEARALPNLGPTSRALSAGDSLVVVPPRSIVLVRRGRPAPQAPHVLHAAWTPGRLQPSDTLELFASVEAEGRRVSGASWTLGSASGRNLASFDGAWDGSREGVVVRVPATSLPRGVGQVLKLAFAIEGAPALTVPVQIDNEDVPRALRFLDPFDQPGLLAKNGQGWWAYGNGNNGTTMAIERVEDPEGGHFQGAFRIVQPPSQSWPNFALSGLNLTAGDFPADWKTFRGLVFDLKTRHDGAQGKFLVQALTTTVKDYDDFQASLPNTDGAWRRVWLRWDAFDQAGWGKDLGAFDPSVVRAIQFRADGAGAGSVEIANLAFWGTEGAALELKDPPRPSRGPMRR